MEDEEWAEVSIQSSNECLTDANFHFIKYTSSTVTKSGTKLIIDTEVHNISGTYDILIAGYKNNKFVTMKRVPYDKQNPPYTLEGDIDEIKIMVTNSLSTLKPLCEAEEISSREFITE